MSLEPTPFTAAAAGLVSALAWPLAWSRFGGQGSDGGIEMIMATLLLVALPAHACVVGFGRLNQAPPRAIDMELVKRIGAWLGTAAATSLIGAALGFWG
jgi:hypothetical protein